MSFSFTLNSYFYNYYEDKTLVIFEPILQKDRHYEILKTIINQMRERDSVYAT